MLFFMVAENMDLQIKSKVSNREVEILQMISEGNTVKEIAGSLYLSEHTVISHKKNLTAKLSAKNCVDLIVKAIKMGLINL